MKKLILVMAIATCYSCTDSHNGDNNNDTTDTASLNPAASNELNNADIPAGDRGVPDSSIGATTNAKAPDSNATNPNIR